MSEEMMKQAEKMLLFSFDLLMEKKGAAEALYQVLETTNSVESKKLTIQILCENNRI
jgi:hypothetical protein